MSWRNLLRTWMAAPSLTPHEEARYCLFFGCARYYLKRVPLDWVPAGEIEREMGAMSMRITPLSSKMASSPLCPEHAIELRTRIWNARLREEIEL